MTVEQIRAISKACRKVEEANELVRKVYFEIRDDDVKESEILWRAVMALECAEADLS